MPKIQYKNHRFRKEALEIISTANHIIRELQRQGYDLTVRQLYYQFVARDLIPNTERSYSKLQSIINNGRLAGQIDWSAIVDRTRVHKSNSHWESPKEIIQSATDSFALDTRATQDIYLEVWVEKDALVGVVGNICEELDIPYLSCRGFVSQSAMWQAAQRFEDKSRGRRECPILLHLGDHDPSGIDMTRDIQDRLELFETDTKVIRIALTMDQIDEFNPPPNFAKITDSRYEPYRDLYGEESWELDALNPRTITTIIQEHVAQYTDEEKRQEIIDQQETEREKLQHIADNWKDE